MNLYDIHTHHISETHTDNGYNIKSICNLYPNDVKSIAEIEEQENVFYSCGIHPYYIDKVEEQYSILESIANNKNVVAIGEVGLDKLRGNNRIEQERIFRLQIELALELQKPLIVHCVKDWDELVALHKEYKPSTPWILHGYRGKPQQASQLAALGIKFSIGENFNHETIYTIPIHSIFCETDESNLSILTIYQKIASVLKKELAELVFNVADNVRYAFKM